MASEPVVTFSLRLPVDLDKDLREEAKRTGYSLNATIIAWLRRGADRT